MLCEQAPGLPGRAASSCVSGGSADGPNNLRTTMETFTPLAGNTYYVVVPQNGTREGSYGVDSTLTERPVGDGECLPQEIGSCE